MGLFTPLYNLPNHVLEKQKMFQNDARHIIFRGPRARLYVGGFSALFAVGMIGTTYGTFQLVKGKD
ncbi:hypothetical protein EST38_g11 [Candolleomyces aberdarensis]|uniref:Uncharacterized protein n=1 Tax=Candolleomyces aberdarensis TaxID=2316362 RepID=A0A4Q2E1K8_9AGAR|nr:hypothetical protein EST38_g11 [Candolleomyces aberdarensis]